MKYRATIPGTENVLIGYRADAIKSHLSDATELSWHFYPLAGDRKAMWYLPLTRVDGWVVETIAELPTKRNAIIKFVDRFGNIVYAWHSAIDPNYTWDYADEGLIDEKDLLLQINSGNGDFEVIFEGTED